MAIRIPLQPGWSTLIDEQDLPLIFKYRFRALHVGKGKFYVAYQPRINGRKTTRYLHRLILPTPPGLRVDHIDCDPMNNQRSNLRIVTAGQNQENRRGATRKSSTGIRNVGVFGNGYRVQIKTNGRNIYCGLYRNLAEAERAAIAARRKYMTHASDCTTH